VIAEDLTGQAHASQAFGGKRRPLGLRAPLRFTLDELDPTRRAPGAAAARMKLIDAGVLLERQDKALPVRNLEDPDTFNGQLGHERSS
jgi:hypothetical protein